MLIGVGIASVAIVSGGVVGLAYFCRSRNRTKRRDILATVGIAVSGVLLSTLLLAGVFVLPELLKSRSAQLCARAALDDLNNGRLPALSRKMSEDEIDEVESMKGTDFGRYQLDRWEVEFGDIYRYIVTTEDGRRFHCAVEPAEDGRFLLRLLRVLT